MSYKDKIDHILAGSAVSAGNAGRPDRQLEQNIQYVKDVLDAAMLGQALFIRDAAVDSSLVVGQPVYWDSSEQQFMAALAAVETDTESGVLVPAESSHVVGLIHSKNSSSSLADIVVLGWNELDISNAVDAEVEAGRYYLSSSNPGKLTQQRPPVSVPVLFANGQGSVLVLPALRDFLEDHIHYSFELTARPAGVHVPPGMGGRHSISSPDDSLQGWLPADHSSFDGKAPQGAAFGYNLAAHQALDRVWPPIPISAATVVWDKGESHVGGTDVPLGSNGLVVLDQNGIWWMSDCYEDVPWPADLDTSPVSSSSSSSSSSVSSSESIQPECPRVEQMRVVLSFARMTFATDKSVVTSLKAADDSPVIITNCDGDEASTGDLELDVNLALSIDDNEEPGHQVIKDIEGKTLQRGPVVEGLLAGAGDITLSSTAKRTLEGGATLHQGQVTVSLASASSEQEVPPQIVRLSDVREDYYQDVPFLEFPAAYSSEARLRFQLPPAGLPSTPKLKIRAVLLGRTAGTLPPMTMTYRKLPRPSDGFSTPVSLPTSDSALTFDSNKAIGTDEYIEIESAEISIDPGDTVLVSLSRSSGDGYSADVGLLRIGGIIVAG